MIVLHFVLRADRDGCTPLLDEAGFPSLSTFWPKALNIKNKRAGMLPGFHGPASEGLRLFPTSVVARLDTNHVETPA